MRTKTGNAIFKIITQHHGSAEAISAPDICRELGIPISREREVRRIIADENALWPGIVVCATPGEGYFCAGTFEELVKYDNWLSQLSSQAAQKRESFRAAAKQLGFNIASLPPLQAAA